MKRGNEECRNRQAVRNSLEGGRTQREGEEGDELPQIRGLAHTVSRRSGVQLHETTFGEPWKVPDTSLYIPP